MYQRYTYAEHRGIVSEICMPKLANRVYSRRPLSQFFFETRSKGKTNTFEFQEPQRQVWESGKELWQIPPVE